MNSDRRTITPVQRCMEKKHAPLPPCTVTCLHGDRTTPRRREEPTNTISTAVLDDVQCARPGSSCALVKRAWRHAHLPRIWVTIVVCRWTLKYRFCFFQLAFSTAFHSTSLIMRTRLFICYFATAVCTSMLPRCDCPYMLWCCIPSVYLTSVSTSSRRHDIRARAFKYGWCACLISFNFMRLPESAL